MKLYELRPISNLSEEDDLWEPWYDKTFGFIVRASSEERARQIASENCGGEGRQAWLSKKYSTCKEVIESGDEELIIHDHHSA